MKNLIIFIMLSLLINVAISDELTKEKRKDILLLISIIDAEKIGERFVNNFI